MIVYDFLIEYPLAITLFFSPLAVFIIRRIIKKIIKKNVNLSLSADRGKTAVLPPPVIGSFGKVKSAVYEINAEKNAAAYVDGNPNLSLTLKINPGDDSVELYLQGNRIGRVFQNEIINCLKYKTPVFASLNGYNIKQNRISVLVTFYKPLSEFVSKDFVLIRTEEKDLSGRERTDNLFRCKQGEFINIVYNGFSKKNICCNEAGAEIGELPVYCESFFNENNAVSYIGVLSYVINEKDATVKASIKAYCHQADQLTVLK